MDGSIFELLFSKEFGLILAGILASMLGMLLPIYVAAFRKHKSYLAICFFSLTFGWTGIGWLVALIWSGTGNVEVTA